MRELQEIIWKMIYSNYCIDPTAGFDINPVTKEATPRKLGYWVMTIEEAEEKLRERRAKGEFDKA